MDGLPKDILLSIFLTAGPHEWRRIAPVCQTWAELIRNYIKNTANVISSGRPNSSPLDPLSGPFVRYTTIPLIEIFRATVTLSINNVSCTCLRADIGKLLSKHVDGPDSFRRIFQETVTPEELALITGSKLPESFVCEPIPIITCIIWAGSIRCSSLVTDILMIIVGGYQNSWLADNDIRDALLFLRSWQHWDIIFDQVDGYDKSYYTVVRAVRNWAQNKFELPEYFKRDRVDIYYAITGLLFSREQIQNTNTAEVIERMNQITRPAIREFLVSKWGLEQ